MGIRGEQKLLGVLGARLGGPFEASDLVTCPGALTNGAALGVAIGASLSRFLGLPWCPGTAPQSPDLVNYFFILLSYFRLGLFAVFRGSGRCPLPGGGGRAQSWSGGPLYKTAAPRQKQEQEQELEVRI